MRSKPNSSAADVCAMMAAGLPDPEPWVTEWELSARGGGREIRYLYVKNGDGSFALKSVSIDYPTGTPE